MGARGRKKNGASTPAALGDEDAFATAAAELSGEVHTFEALTVRLGKLDLVSGEKMAKAAELLAQAAQSHHRFVECLRAMVAGIEDARARQNRSAEALSQIEEALVERRGEHDALRERFEQLGEAARDVRGLLTGEGGASEGGASEGGAPAGERVTAARERLDELLAAAKDLATAARDAQLVDLEQEGHATCQRLEALARKLARVPGS